MKYLKKIFYAFFLGALILTPLDWIQVHYGIAEYTNPTFLHLAWWTWPAYGLVFVFMVLLFPPLEDLLTATFSFDHRYVILELIPILLAGIGPVLSQNYPLLIVFILGIYVLVRLGFFHAKWDWLFFVIGALVGPTVELCLISFNLYHFGDPDFLGIPYWLPLFWGIVALSGRRIAYKVEDLVK